MQSKNSCKASRRTGSYLVGALCVLIVNTGCTGAEVQRKLCVGRASLAYHETISQCKADGIKTYEECDQEYALESTFEKSQKECRP